MQSDQDSKLRILPLGGLGEIGMNMMAVEYQNDAVIIDAGIMFPDESMPGVDLVIQDIDALLELKWNILGILITHGHEDHIGALPYVLARISAPVFATRLTMGLAESKLEEFALLDKTTRHVVASDDVIKLGPFEVYLFPMCHSVADGVALGIKTPVGSIVHSGDFKIDPDPIDGRISDLEGLASFAAENEVLLLLSDSTNAENPGHAGPELSIRPTLEAIFREAEGRVFFATFASNIHRIQQVLDLARQFDRKVVLVGRSMEGNAKVAANLGYLNVPSGVYLDIKHMNDFPDHRITVLSTGSQGEPMSALALMAQDRHKYLSAKPGDVLVLSSRFIPGNEKAITSIINEFIKRGALVRYEKNGNVHVSGHAYQEELRSMIRAVQPYYFMPVHGEYRHLVQHGCIAVDEGIPPERVLVAHDGDIIECSKDDCAISGRIDLRRVYVDGKGVGDVGPEVLRDRRAMAEVGLVMAVIGVNRETGELVSGPSLTSLGVTYQDLETELMQGATEAVGERLTELAPGTPAEWEAARDEIRLAIRRHINRKLGRKPVVQTAILFV
ncbi:MAG: ribonuclease J [Pseudomonadota bacterium]